MKWMTHQAGALIAGAALHLPLPALAASVLGAVLPDVLDQRLAGLALTLRGRQRLFNAVHRGTTHWFGWWLAAFAAALCSGADAPWRDMASGLCLGGFSHVLMDMLTPHGVPLFPFSRRRRISLHLCATGSLGEYLLLAVLLGIAWFLLRDEARDIARLIRSAAW